ncbi:LysR family transcriptional regulator [Fulvimarina sp. 2208YS6-2-32]|uniref:LysR family transcriptional regulator n=1 Tax=Fulvimarina uroteuthidis TaxID=3098149 RepID=A0ABU5I4C4_9HYPH|nr:LysR family transcriptional regulator [Fulvimarina sp. 2208YS6-2-32]MDY8110212.1 LysR family transcriptional regulator [Fulvimarina sp. 2208YS6-2-32]
MGHGIDALTWDDIRLIGVIGEAGSLPEAAQRLGTHHSTVFRRLRQIEAATGFPVFEREGQRLAPSAAGVEIVALAARMRGEVDRTAMKVAGREVLPSGELRVATADSLLIHLLTPVFAGFQVACPNVTLDIVVANRALNLSRRDADVAIRATNKPPETLVGRRLCRIGWALYGRRDPAGSGKPEGNRPDWPEADLANCKWVALGEHMSAMKVVHHALEAAAPGRLRYRVDSVLGLAAAIEAGIGIGHLPCFIGDRSPVLSRLAPPEPEFATDLWLLTHESLRRAPRVRAFMDFVSDAIRTQSRTVEGL